MLNTKTLSFDLENKAGPFKILNATNGGPIYKRYSKDQLRTNFESYKAAKMPYQRNLILRGVQKIRRNGNPCRPHRRKLPRKA